MRPHNNMVYSFYKVAEGGPGQKTILFWLKQAEIKARPAQSIYVGMTAVEVFGGKRIQRRAQRIIYGGGQ